jgi:protein involved in polysaccharide export with SLBB domain
MFERLRILLAGCALVLVAAVLFTGGPAASAQGVMPSSDQLDMLRNLTPEQRDAILSQIGKGGSSGSSGRSGSGGGTSDSTRGSSRANRNGNRDATSQPDQRRGSRADGQADNDPYDLFPKKLKPDDSVLIDVEFPKPKLQLPLNALPNGAPAQQGAAGGQVQGVQQQQQQQLQPADDEDTPPLTKLEKEKLKALIELIRSRNPYRLDRTGALQLPGFPGIELAGLNEDEATQRLAAENAFRKLEVRVTRLPLAKVGLEGLKPFGYDLFDDDSPSSFAADTDMPVPAEYVVGPGDELSIQLYGNQNRTLRLTVGRDGRISFPELGPISVGGQRFESVKSGIESRVQRQMIGVRASVAMGDTRSISVFVLGEARHPGSYTVSGLSTVTTALFAAGGVKAIGSLRDIQLKRQGAIVRRLDLYDLLLKGDTANDAKLLPGDAIFIPPVGATIAVDGEVKRPAIYELRGAAQVGDAVELAGGLTPEADTLRASLSRVDDQRRRVVLDVDLETAPGRAQALRNGDVLRVLRVRPQLDSGVVLQGYVNSPAAFAWREGLRVTDVIGSVDDLKPNADLGYVLIRRELPPDRRIVVLSADLSRAWRERGGAADVKLAPRDQVIVFDLESGREREIQRLLAEIRLQARLDRPTNIVRVGGRVKVPGEYPLEPNMTVSSLIRAGGNLSDAAYGGKAELTRYTVVDGEARRTELLDIDLAKVLMGDAAADVPLRPFDFLNIKEIPEWAAQDEVTLEGEFKFPGRYPIKRGETLRSVLARAGGLTDLAFPEGSVFTRKDLREREQKQLDSLSQRLQGDIATLALQAAAANQAGASQAATVGQGLLTQLKKTQAVGRLVIDLDRTVAGGAGDIVLQGGDTLIVPKRSQEVTVLGEVQNGTSLLYRAGLTRDDYVGLAGGTTRKADTRRTYVVRANGSVVSSENSHWFSRASKIEMKPGDTVVVPLDTERLPALPLWQAVTQIIYNLAIAAAAINSF